MADETTTYQMTNARPENYWIAPDALYITLNAMGQPDYLQGNVSSGAVIMCYMRGIDGLSFDAGHNYRRWPLAVAPTYFNTSTPKYVYAAIPKSEAVNAYAQIVYPSEKIDLYGKNAKGEQIGTEGYYFVFLQGIISASVATDGTTQMRSWTQRVDCGSLASDEAIAAGGADSWWQYSSVDDTITFLKTITKAVFDNLTAKVATITKLILGGKSLTGVAEYPTTDVKSEEDVVTPKYISDRADKEFLRKDKDDSTPHTLGINIADIEDRAKSTNYTHTGFPFGKGWAAMKDDGSGASMLEVDKLFVRMKAYFAELEIRKISYLGGNYVFSSAGGTIYYVEWLDENDKVLEKVKENEYLIRTFRCYLYSDDGTTKTMNWFKEDDQVRCQNFGDLNGSPTDNYTSHYWWRRVSAVGSGEIAAKGDGKTYQYIDFDNSSSDQYAEHSDMPRVGDVMVQLGNWSDAERQSAIEICVIGAYAPAFIEWQGIGANNAHFKMPESSYTRLSPKAGNIIRGELINVVDGEGKSVSDIISDMEAKLSEIQKQADKKFEIWFGDGEPHPNSTTDTAAETTPSSEWTTAAEKNLHVQDIYYDMNLEAASNGGRAWRYISVTKDSTTTYYWEKVTDQDTLNALEKICKMQNEHDLKNYLVLFGNAVFDKISSDLDSRGSVNVWLKPSSDPTGAKGDIWYDGTNCKIFGTGWTVQTDISLANALADIEKILGEGKKFVIFGEENSEAQEEHDIELYKYKFTSQSTQKEISSKLQISVWNGKTWEPVQSSDTGILQNLGNEIDAVVMGSDGQGGEIQTGLMSVKGLATVVNKNFNADGSVKESGLKASDGTEMYTKLVGPDGKVISSATVTTGIQYVDETGKWTSVAKIKADYIDLEGYTTINGAFHVEENGNVTMNDAMINNATITGGTLTVGSDNKIVITTPSDEPGGTITGYQGSLDMLKIGITDTNGAEFSSFNSAFYDDGHQTIAKNVAVGPYIRLGHFHGGGGAVFSYWSQNFFYNKHVESLVLNTGGLLFDPIEVNDDIGSNNNLISLDEVDANGMEYGRDDYFYPSVLLFKNTKAMDFTLGDPAARDSRGLIKNKGRFLMCWHMGENVTFKAKSSKQILCHNGEADALISTVFGECYIFVSDGKHWLAQTMNCTF